MCEKFQNYANYETYLLDVNWSSDRGKDDYARAFTQETLALAVSDELFTAEENARGKLAAHFKQMTEDDVEQETKRLRDPLLYGSLMQAAIEGIDWHETAQLWIDRVKEG